MVYYARAHPPCSVARCGIRRNEKINPVQSELLQNALPLMWSHGTGAEVMQRIAVPMIGGMVSSTVLTLVVIPSIYAVVKELGLRRAPRLAPAAQEA